MSLFAEPVRVEFTPDEWAIVDRPIVGDGGAQGVLRALMRGARDRAIVAEDFVLDRVYAYAYRYGGGGFQDRFRMVVRAALRAGWTPR
jgi:hypothetical protein